ncbi:MULTISPECIES: winged helix-turn-helix domain-containing protein [Haloarcula]|uniref:winged helix-turn-helix domain-containing protein n=1 Tax=Haloarcula TaxID=2237 RepID=UPI0023EA7EF0|nr:helix-turn-helix domain-containing protein [Halomicroarcula sp. XH51]
MSDDASIDRQAVFEALADPDCRAILTALDEPRPAKAVAADCDLPQTSTYRKLQQLSEAALVDERTAVRSDGHHETTYVRDCSGVFVAVDGDDPFAVDVVRDGESPDERLARLWSRISEEL